MYSWRDRLNQADNDEQKLQMTVEMLKGVQVWLTLFSEIPTTYTQEQRRYFIQDPIMLIDEVLEGIDRV